MARNAPRSNFSLIDECAIIFAINRPRKDLMKLFIMLGWRQEFSDGGLTLPTRGLKYGFQGTINTKNLRKNPLSPSDEGQACSDGGL